MTAKYDSAVRRQFTNDSFHRLAYCDHVSCFYEAWIPIG